MGSIGMQELIIIGVIVVLLFGGKKFAELGKGVGEGIRGFKRALKDDEPDDEKNK